ncbi:MAG: selenocysteine-specific translation elongation factor, partial [Pirellulaceae bacterium]|nr:selenocysteine-specific translation elongation factor [Pirellulaceae bacterium]
MLNITLGTAGHIDHGKTALIKALTGCETDRLKEEKERGMSIDLGYAPCTIADLEVGIVDVPGHENFIKTMVAGASGIDGVILVVAADDGVMPQTREHLDIISLLGVRHGLVALTKIDRVDAGRRREAAAQLTAYLQGTFLEGKPILPVSNITGEGFDAFLESLGDMVRLIPPKRIDGVFRMPLDRAFSAKGFGTIAAGIPSVGSAAEGDEVVLLPQGMKSRIRRIEVYGQPSKLVQAGQCAAVNLGHLEAGAIDRGDVLTVPGYFSPEELFLCRLRLLPDKKIRLKNASEVKFHTGTSEVSSTAYLLEQGEMQGGEENFVQFRLKRPVVAAPGDTFIVRTSSPARTIGGGTIIEAIERRLKRNRPEVMEDVRSRAESVGDDSRFVEYAVRAAREQAAAESELARRTKIAPVKLRDVLAKLIDRGRIISVGANSFLHADILAEAEERLAARLDDYHREAAESPGMTAEQLRREFPWPKAVFDAVVAKSKDGGRIVERTGRLALASHQPTFKDQDAPLLEKIEEVYRSNLFKPPGADEAAKQAGAPPEKIDRLLGILCEHQRLTMVEKGMYFHRDAIERAKQLVVAHIGEKGRLESVDFKYMLDTTRKYALPLLDHFDRVG